MTTSVTGITELVLESRDLAASEAFYADVLGLPVCLRWEPPEFEGREAVWFQAGDARIGLWTPQVGLAEARPGRHVHFAMTVAEADYVDTVRRLRAAGAAVAEYVFGDDDEAAGQRSAYVADPDGHIVEFWTRQPSRQTDAGAPRRVHQQ